MDKRGPGRGSTVASTALVQYEIDTPLTCSSARSARERRARLAPVAPCRRALAARLKNWKLTDVARRNSLYLAGNILGKGELRREHEARSASGLPSRFLDRKALREIWNRTGGGARGLWQPRDRSAQGGARVLAGCASPMARRVFSGVEMWTLKPKKRGVIATTDNGCRISATISFSPPATSFRMASAPASQDHVDLGDRDGPPGAQ